ncbi:MAG TPA: cistern family PEP-CTERM protein [Oscillatoriales cyanobacterium M59_W2019_021]|nr:MAG: PEP-CTERM sorting domain-containing protein [Cyanobacteria bacterium J055]HIK31384.1 cistern family PEP-CTERM protein [Oscillatoriales cyanobacterium M4454_W2019_049]HIK50805.1 cistern family PEP-CTERM protein [Oscillatoriales cyanobacterium M59_W2019_021]
MKVSTSAFSKVALGLSAVSTLGLAFLAGAPSASAFTLNGGSVTGITSDDVGKSFEIEFDGNVATQNVDGLKSKAIFKLLSFDGDSAEWDIMLSNLSDGGINSRTSVLGFNLDGVDLPRRNFGTSTGLFSNVVKDGSLPNQFGALDVCFTNGNNCQGGRNGGVFAGSSGNFTATLNFASAVSSFGLSNFGVRYQSIDGNGFNGDSGTGRGMTVTPPTSDKDVPEPMTIVGSAMALGFGSALKRRGKKQQKAA